MRKQAPLLPASPGFIKRDFNLANTALFFRSLRAKNNLLLAVCADGVAVPVLVYHRVEDGRQRVLHEVFGFEGRGLGLGGHAEEGGEEGAGHDGLGGWLLGEVGGGWF